MSWAGRLARAALPQLPAIAGDLWLATPPTVRKIEVARARRAAEALAPRVLLGRAVELAALEEFAGSELRWRWIQGDAFAVKTALMAWFALHPPERVAVAACFLRRASGEDTAEYALDVLTRQLAVLADRHGYLPPPFASERSNDFADLLEEAARAGADRSRRLLVLIDGLDEYDPTTGAWTWPTGCPATVRCQIRRCCWPPAAPEPTSAFLLAIRCPASCSASAPPRLLPRSGRPRTRNSTGPRGLPADSFCLLCCLAVAGSGLTASDMCALLKRRGRDADVSEIEAQLGNSSAAVSCASPIRMALENRHMRLLTTRS